MAREKILVFCAHNDDQIIGPGGTLIKYAKEGRKFKTVIFSYGESSHPHFKREVIVKTRVKEAQRSDKIMGGSGILFLGLKEGHFEEEFKMRNMKRKIKELILATKPTKIFTHSLDDPHPDHHAVYKIVTNILDKMKYKCDLYLFNVWNPINLRERDAPKLVVDITKTFKKKIEAFKIQKSQKLTFFTLIWNIYFQDWKNGLKNRTKYAEVFYKIK